jgi:hypothetical protein
LQGEEGFGRQGKGIRSSRATADAEYTAQRRGEIRRCFVERFGRVLIAANTGIEPRGITGEDREL